MRGEELPAAIQRSLSVGIFDILDPGNLAAKPEKFRTVQKGCGFRPIVIGIAIGFTAEGQQVHVEEKLKSGDTDLTPGRSGIVQSLLRRQIPKGARVPPCVK